MEQQTVQNQSLWEANSPQCFDDIAFADDVIRLDLRDYATTPSLTGNVVLYGPVGTGKTTIAQMILAERLLNPICGRELNGEQWQDDSIRNIDGVYNYAGMTNDVPVIIINEVDRLGRAQFALRQFLDSRKQQGLVVMTTNHLGQLDASIIDRSDCFPISGFTAAQATPLAQRVLQSVGVTINDDKLEQMLSARLVGDQVELSLRQIGLLVDKLARINSVSPHPPQIQPHLRLVKSDK